MTLPLTRTWKFVSPVYQARFKERVIQEEDDGTRTTMQFHEVQEDQFEDWLQKNYLFKVPSRSSAFHSEIGYAIVGKDDLSGKMNGIHIIHPNFRRLEWVRKPKDLPKEEQNDDFYYRELLILTQPFGVNLPKQLEDKLKEWNYKEVEEFKPYK